MQGNFGFIVARDVDARTVIEILRDYLLWESVT